MNAPVGKISRTAWMDAPETLQVMMALCGEDGDNGDEARFVGGCVRDAILNVKTYDIDIATVHMPDEVMARLKKNKIKAIPTGIDHGTITAVVDNQPFEITTLRRDVKTDGRHAQVAFTNEWHEDAARRDFTINALYANIRGEVYDYFNGLQDAKDGCVTFIRDADARITEDYLRILRFYRFTARFARLDNIDTAARNACRHHAKHLNQISAERIQTEILKLLQAQHAATVWQMMIDDQIIGVILPATKHVQNLKNLIKLEDAFECESDPMRRLSALIGFDAIAAKNLNKTLKLSNNDKKNLIALCGHKAELLSADEQKLRREIYINGAGHVRSALLLQAAAKNIESGQIADQIDTIVKTRLPDFPINGRDIQQSGIPQGPETGRILKDIEKWWVDHDFKPNRTETLDKLNEITAKN